VNGRPDSVNGNVRLSVSVHPGFDKTGGSGHGEGEMTTALTRIPAPLPMQRAGVCAFIISFVVLILPH
jgi:hypothetical protein